MSYQEVRETSQQIALFLRKALSRLRRAGWNSMKVYIRCAATNTILRAGNRVLPHRVECPCCDWRGFDFLMLDCGTFVVPTVECPHCFSQERQRMLYLYLSRRQPEFFKRAGRVLHFAPEHHVRTLIARNPNLTYFATDFSRDAISGVEGNRFQADMMNMSIADNSVDVLFCLHVLEHVPDDRKGILELKRILKPGGVAFIMVPFMMGWPKTVEFGKPDPMIFDHVRGYSPVDFTERLAPFAFEEIVPDSFLTEDELRRYRIPRDSQVLYRCA